MPEITTGLRRLLEMLVQRSGSDLFLVVGLPPAIRINGVVQRLETDPLDEKDIEAAVLPSMPAHAAEQYRKSGYADSSLRLDGLGRFRINLHRERGRPAATFRALPSRPPRLSELGLPSNILALTRLPYGLVLIGG